MKKFLAVILALVFALSGMSVMAFAAGMTNENQIPASRR